MSRVRRALTQELAVVVPTIERQAVPAIACIAGSQWPNLVLVRDGVKESNWPISAARNVAHDCGNECPRIVVTDSSGSGASAARNEGWRQTKAKWILFLDDDVSALFFGRDELTHALAKQLPSVGVIGLRVLCPSKPRGRQALVDHSVSLDRGPTSFESNGPTPAKDAWRHGAGAALLVRRECLASVGGFCDRLGAGQPGGGAEDLDLIIQALRTGWSVRYEPTLRVQHPIDANPPELRRKLDAYGNAINSMVRLRGLDNDILRNYETHERAALSLLDDLLIVDPLDADR